MYRFSTIPIKIPMTYFREIEQIFQKFTKMETQKTSNNNSDLEKEEQNWKNHAT